MYLNSCAKVAPLRRFFAPQLIKVMKLTALFITIACLQVSAKVYSQISLSEKNVPLAKVISSIQQQSGYSFFYKHKLVENINITTELHNVTLKQAMDQVLAGQPLTYEVIDKTVVIKQKEKQTEKKITEIAVPTTVSGRVTDTVGTPLIGAAVTIDRLKRGVTTNDNGEFSITAQTGDLLLISFVGYKTFEFTVGDQNIQQFNIELHPLVSGLKEVIVSNGYQVLPLERTTGSYDYIDNKLYTREYSPDVLSRLEGITNATLFYHTSQAGAPAIQIRGYSTLNSNPNPLIVVDNFPYDGDINNINPNDVESVTILKDAAASSIWGSRAGNGVIVITTKKGKFNQPLQVSFNSNIQFTGKPNIKSDRSFLDSKDYIDIETYLFNQGFDDNALSDNYYYSPVTPVTSLLDSVRRGLVAKSYADNKINQLSKIDVRNDLLKYFYQEQVNQQYQLNLSTGSAKTNQYFSIGYDKSLQSTVGFSNDRLTINSQNSFRPIKNLTLNVGFYYTQSKQVNNSILPQLEPGYIYSALYPYAQLADNNGNPLPIVHGYAPSFVNQATQNGFLNWQFYPLAELRNGDDNSIYKNYDARIETSLNYTIFNGLSANLNYKYERAYAPNSTLFTTESYYARNLINMYSNFNGNQFLSYNIPYGGIETDGLNQTNSQAARASLSYNKSWDKNSISAIAGYEITQLLSTGNTNQQFGVDPNLGLSSPVDYKTYFNLYPAGSGQIGYSAQYAGNTSRTVSEFSELGYTYDNRYTLTGSARRDGSNIFGVNTNNKFKPLWSAGLGWNLSNEKFYGLSFLPILKLKATYGYSGNVNTQVVGQTTIIYQGAPAAYTGNKVADISSYPNPNLKWEDDRHINFGLDFATKNSSLTGTLEYFLKKSTDLIANVTLDPTLGTGYGGSLPENSASLQGRGIDVTLASKNIKGKFQWSTNLLFTYYKDKVTKIDVTNVPVASNYVGATNAPSARIGYPVASVWAYKWAGLDPTNGDPQGYLNGQVIKDYNSIFNAPISSLVYKGTAIPLYFGSIMNTFSYLNFSLSANITYRFDYYFQKSTVGYSGLPGGGYNIDYLKRWQKPGDERFTTVPSFIYPFDSLRDQFYSYSEPNFLRGDNIRLQDVRLGYTFKNNNHSLGFKDITLFAFASNLGIIWRANKEGIDPDYANYGPSKSVALGLNVNF